MSIPLRPTRRARQIKTERLRTVEIDFSGLELDVLAYALARAPAPSPEEDINTMIARIDAFWRSYREQEGHAAWPLMPPPPPAPLEPMWQDMTPVPEDEEV